MLHRTQWSLLLIWKATFRDPPSPHPIMSKGALTIPGFTFTNFLAGSSGQIECVTVYYMCAHAFILSMYVELLLIFEKGHCGRSRGRLCNRIS